MKFYDEFYFQDSAVWKKNFPSITKCFQHTVLVWIPCVFLFCISPILIVQISYGRSLPLPWTRRIIAKLTCSAILITISSYLFLLPFAQSMFIGIPHAVDFVYPFMLLVAMILHLAFIFGCRQYGMVTSGGLFLSWLLFVVCGLPEMLYWIHHTFRAKVWHTIEVYRRGAQLIWWPVCLVQLLLHCFADSPPSSYKTINNRGTPSPEVLSSFINRVTMWWFTDVCKKGVQKPLEVSDLYALNDDDCSAVLVPKWSKLWGRKLSESDQRQSRRSSPKVKPPSIIWCLFLLFKWDIITAMITKAISDLLQFCNPLLLRSLIRFTEDSRVPLWQGLSLALAMFSTSELSSLMQSHYYYLMYRVGTRVQTCLTAAVYKKTLLLSSAARRTKTVGEIVNLMSIDIDRFQQISPQTMQYWSNPLQICLALFFLWHQVGVAVLSGVAVMLMLFPINFFITMLIRGCQVQQMYYKDERTKMVNEVLNGIKVIKLYAWEPPMERVITDLREKELTLIRRASLLRTLSDMFNSASPFLVALSTFSTFIILDESNVLTPEIAFVSLTLFNQLRTPMSQLAEIITQTVQVAVSNNRLTEFLISDELAPDCVDRVARDDDQVVKVSQATFAWDRSDLEPILHNLSMTVKKGQLITIVGRVGHGKSSFLQALLGEYMDKLQGYVGLSGRIAYVPQQPWMQNQTIRQNITFGKKYDEYFYNRVLDACALYPDLQMLPLGDMTEIGEKGINLSGGQKARISLARAVYQNHDVYLMDDPMSAVDSHVGAQLFSSVIGPEGMLRNKTRVLVTNELSFLHHSDLIYIMKDGRIEHQGTYKDLMQAGALEPLLEECEKEEEQRKSKVEDEEEQGFEELCDDYVDDILDSPTIDPILGTSHMSTVSGILARRHISTSTVKQHRRRWQSGEKSGVGTSIDLSCRQLTSAERVETGRIKFSTYLNYFGAMGATMAVLFVVGMSLSTAFSMSFKIFRSLASRWSGASCAFVGVF
ncbi:unnamed protein product [Heligmosomoides polygyrus]|uniref:ABC transporter domain-containing protein n=1 Tax=Heligmosomoides polygyrus TaxID=6339 RepID=A0A3P7U2Q7_HELPZ|nr:unnamed protein product [Heligmosomoides polygyrus]